MTANVWEHYTANVQKNVGGVLDQDFGRCIAKKIKNTSCLLIFTVYNLHFTLYNNYIKYRPYCMHNSDKILIYCL